MVLTDDVFHPIAGINAFSGSLGVPGVHGARYVSVEALKPQDSYVRVPRQEDCTHRS